jgi:hypothetical protein
MLFVPIRLLLKNYFVVFISMNGLLLLKFQAINSLCIMSFMDGTFLNNFLFFSVIRRMIIQTYQVLKTWQV